MGDIKTFVNNNFFAYRERLPMCVFEKTLVMIDVEEVAENIAVTGTINVFQ